MKKLTFEIGMFILIFLFSGTNIIASKSKSGTKLIITITDIKQSKGKIRIALFNKAKDFPKDHARIRGIDIIAKKGKVTGFFANLPPGTYAIAVFHDTNGNKKIDKNFFGIPKEAYGFSQNARGMFGPPSFKKATFIIGKKTLSIKIKLK